MSASRCTQLAFYPITAVRLRNSLNEIKEGGIQNLDLLDAQSKLLLALRFVSRISVTPAHPRPAKVIWFSRALAASGGSVVSVLCSACVAPLGCPRDRHMGGAEIRSKVSRSCLATSVWSHLSPPRGKVTLLRREFVSAMLHVLS